MQALEKDTHMQAFFDIYDAELQPGSLNPVEEVKDTSQLLAMRIEEKNTMPKTPDLKELMKEAQELQSKMQDAQKLMHSMEAGGINRFNFNYPAAYFSLFYDRSSEKTPTKAGATTTPRPL